MSRQTRSRRSVDVGPNQQIIAQASVRVTTGPTSRQQSTRGTTSQKHANFVAEPIRGKAVKNLAGVGPVLGERLQRAGINRADQVLGKYLEHSGDQRAFQDWMKDTCGASTKHSSDTYRCLNEWSNNFLN